MTNNNPLWQPEELQYEQFQYESCRNTESGELLVVEEIAGPDGVKYETLILEPNGQEVSMTLVEKASSLEYAARVAREARGADGRYTVEE